MSSDPLTVVVLGNDAYLPEDRFLERVEVLCRHPKLSVDAAADLLLGVGAIASMRTSKPGHVANWSWRAYLEFQSRAICSVYAKFVTG